jgi:hypothetical protein
VELGVQTATENSEAAEIKVFLACI